MEKEALRLGLEEEAAEFLKRSHWTSLEVQ